MKRPILVWLLIFLLVFLGLGGIYGGISMLVDPTGKALQMDGVLPLLPVPNFILPGLFLISVMGAFPLFLVFGLIWKPEWAWAATLSRWSKHYWAWTGSVAVGIVLIIWLAIQAVLIGFQWPIQYITLAIGLLIVFVAIIPNIRKYYSETQETTVGVRQIEHKRLSLGAAQPNPPLPLSQTVGRHTPPA